MPKFICLPSRSNALGDLLKQELLSGQWIEFRAAVAFARLAGVRHIAEELRVFGVTGRIKLSIGVKNLPTTPEALELLLSSLGDRGEIWIFHHEGGPVFHPKLFVFKAPNKLKIFVGSGNLTQGGLYENYEAIWSCELDLSDTQDRTNALEIERALDDWSTSSPVCKRLSAALIRELQDGGYLVPEARVSEAFTPERFGVLSRRRIILFGRRQEPRAPRLPRANPRVPRRSRGGAQRRQSAVRFWFETGELTSASRNQLDLSKIGREGHPGGISFFGIPPDQTAQTQDIIIRFNNKDFHPNRIFYGQDNGTWRIRFSGRTSDGERLSQISRSTFRHKILVFQNIAPNRYNLECLPLDQKERVAEQSEWVDKNRGVRGREYGMLTQ